jgi:hypothetical protein
MRTHVHAKAGKWRNFLPLSRAAVSEMCLRIMPPPILVLTIYLAASFIHPWRSATEAGRRGGGRRSISRTPTSRQHGGLHGDHSAPPPANRGGGVRVGKGYREDAIKSPCPASPRPSANCGKGPHPLRKIRFIELRQRPARADLVSRKHSFLKRFFREVLRMEPNSADEEAWPHRATTSRPRPAAGFTAGEFHDTEHGRRA